MKYYSFIIPLLMMCFLLSCTSDGRESNEIRFKLESLDNEKQYSLEDFEGKAVVLNFWASWCAPCKKELPILEKMSNEFNENQVQFIGINIMDDRKDALSLKSEYRISYLNLYDAKGRVSDMYGVTALPVTVFINKDGEISGKKFGPFLGEEGEKQLKSEIRGLIQ